MYLEDGLERDLCQNEARKPETKAENYGKICLLGTRALEVAL